MIWYSNNATVVKRNVQGEWTSDEIYRFEGHVDERAMYKDRTKCERSRWGRRTNEWRGGRESQAVVVENSIKLLQFGASSSFLKSMKLERGGNHDSIVRLRCLFFAGADLGCCGD